MEPAMAQINVTEFRQRLQQYLERARRGERLKITSRGSVIAELSPPSASPRQAQAARRLLRGSVVRYDRPLEPVVDPAEWTVNR